MSYFSTLILYVCIWLVTTLFGFCAQTKVVFPGGFIGLIFKPIPFFLTFFIHAAIICFTNIGADYESYCRMFNLVTVNNFYLGEERLFYLLGLILKTICGDVEIAVFFVKLLTLIVFYVSFFLVREQIRIGFSILAFNTLIFFNAFYLLSMQINIAFLTLSFAYILRKNKILCAITFFIAINLHLSSVLLLPVYIMYFMVDFWKNEFPKWGIPFLIVMWAGVLIFAQRLGDFMMSNFAFFDNYSSYSFVSSYHGSGIMQYVFFVPLFVLIYILYTYTHDRTPKNIGVCFIVPAFFFALLGYKFEVLSRINDSFFGIYAFFVPAYLFRHEQTVFNKNSRFYAIDYSIECLLWICYLCLRCVFVIISKMSAESTSLVSSYHFFNPFGI